MSAAKLLRGLVSKTDEALVTLKREKGTGAEFLRELEKTPGVKPAEIKDRRLDKVLPAMGKTTKAEVKKVLDQNPPPRVEETVLGQENVQVKWFSPKGAKDAGLDRSGYAVVDQGGKVLDGPYDSLYKAESAIESMDNVAAPPKYGEYQLPGGENYREILLRLPSKRLSEEEARRVINAKPDAKLSDADIDYATRKFAQEYRSSHWDEPNVLAHARVSDRTGPNGERILHIEEIQSDWHQAGRKKGYLSLEKAADLKKQKTKAESDLREIEREYNRAKEASKGLDAKIASPEFATLPPEKQAQFRESAQSWGRAWMDRLPALMKAREVYDSIPDAAILAGNMVPDAPFKKSWHELTMKRLLNYAAENNYDRIAVTPGAEQASRYDLSQKIDSLNFSKNSQGTVDIAAVRGDNVVIDKTMQTPEQLESLVGKELAQKILDAPNTNGEFSGLDLQVGGEGMKGFYDKILPDYLNSLGKPYGTQVGQYDLNGVPLHSFDITPQMRQEITSKGLPLYSVPAIEGAAATGAGAALLGEEEKPPVHISDNPDTMRLELEDKQMAGGGIAKALKGAAKAAAEVPPALPRAAAKTKAEIEDIAQRMAPQVTGEFVRRPGKTASVADKPRKQFERERDLPVELTAPERQLTPSTLDIEKLKGNVVIGVPGDPTITGRSLVSVGERRLDSPSPQHGGPLYGLGREDEFWASGIGPATRVQNLAAEASQQYGAPVLGKYIMMGPESINYAQHFADANLQAIDLSKMTKRQIEGFNKILKQGSPKSGPRPSFSGIENKEEAYLWFAMDPEFRKHFNAVMQQPTITEKFNLPSGADIRYAITEPALRDLETGVTGFSVGKLRPEVGPSGLKLSTHPTYSHDIPGEFMGQTRYPAPYELSFPDTLRAVRENPAQAPQEFGSLKMVGPRQIIDQQMIDEIRTYEEAMKRLTGKKKGGKVNKKGKVQFSANAQAMREELVSKRK